MCPKITFFVVSHVYIGLFNINTCNHDHVPRYETLIRNTSINESTFDIFQILFQLSNNSNF